MTRSVLHFRVSLPNKHSKLGGQFQGNLVCMFRTRARSKRKKKGTVRKEKDAVESGKKSKGRLRTEKWKRRGREVRESRVKVRGRQMENKKQIGSPLISSPATHYATKQCTSQGHELNTEPTTSEKSSPAST